MAPTVKSATTIADIQRPGRGSGRTWFSVTCSLLTVYLPGLSSAVLSAASWAPYWDKIFSR